MKLKLLLMAAVVPLMAFASDTFSVNDQPTTAAVGATEIMLEAETAKLSGPMKITPDGMAFGNLCINGYSINRRGWATFEVMIPKEDDYVIWGRVNGRDGYTNSFFVQANNGPQLIWEFHKNNRYEWDRVSDRGNGSYTQPQTDPVVFHFQAGKNVIVIGNREKETRLDRLIITNDLNKVYDGAPAATLRLDAPAMADVLVPGSTVEIKWTAQNISNKVNIDLSFDLGAGFAVPVVHNTENDGSYLWTVPASYNRPKVMMRISDAAGGPYDQNRGYFSIVQPEKVSLTLLTPIGGETLQAGTIYIIKWKEYAFNGIVQILFSKDNGASWDVIADNQNAAGENYWLVPNITADKCLIKIQDTVDGQPWDKSKSTFKIFGGAGTLNKSGADLAALPTEFTLTPNFPNPFNPTTTITYGVPEAGEVSLVVYDMRGRQVAVLAEGLREAGWHQANWNAAEFPSGVYTAVLQAGSARSWQRMTLIK